MLTKRRQTKLTLATQVGGEQNKRQNEQDATSNLHGVVSLAVRCFLGFRDWAVDLVEKIRRRVLIRQTEI